MLKIFLKIFVFGYFVIGLYSCTSLSKNMSKKGTLSLYGGVFQDSHWKEPLRFNRYSWYKELSLVFDLLVTKVDEKSPFYKWFSNTEKEYLEKCVEWYVSASYVMDNKRIGSSDFKDQYTKSGFERFALSSFKKHLVMHPNYETLSLQLYDVYGLCRKAPSENEFSISFPGFSKISIK